MPKATTSKAGGSNRKIGREKRKHANAGSPLGRFVRGAISAKEYWSETGIK